MCIQNNLAKLEKSNFFELVYLKIWGNFCEYYKLILCISTCHNAWPSAHWTCNLDPDTLWWPIRASPDQMQLGRECDCSGYHILATRHCLGEYRYRTTFWRWEPVPMLLLPLPMEHPLRKDGIGPPFPLMIRTNHENSTYLKL